MKIYARERQKVGTGVKQPRFRVVAVVEEKGEDKHLRSTDDRWSGKSGREESPSSAGQDGR